MASLARLLQPKSIAVIGGGAWCASVVEQCRRMGFAGPVWPVHPTKSEIGGTSAFRDLSELPDAPDAVFIGVNRNLTIQMVRELSSLGAGGAICFASGFREAQAETGDGSSLQDALLEAAGEMPIVGPNCYGFINYLDGALLWPDQHGGARVDRGVAVLMQSSNMAINVTMQTRGLPIAYIATAGNQAQVGISDIGMALLEDTRVTALGMHIEGIGDLRAFERLAERAKELGKPIVVMKAGKSAQAQAAAISHTASLAGSDAGSRALFKRLGIAQVDSLPSFLETLKLLNFYGPLSSNRIVSMSCSGGEASLIADAAETYSVEFPALSEAQRAGLRTALGPMVALANPLDYHTFIWTDIERMTQTFSAAIDSDIAIGCLIVDFPRSDRCDPSAWDSVITSGASAAKATGKPLMLVSTLPETMPESVAQDAINAGLIPMHGINDTLCAVEAAAFLGQKHQTPPPLLLPGTTEESQTLAEADAKAALAEFGVRLPRSVNVDNLQKLGEAASTVGYPCVLKAVGLAHKTEAGGVALGLSDEGQVTTAAARMPSKSFLIEEMVTGGIAELLIGVVRDPAHGFVLTLAAGGTLTEILSDSASCLLPATETDIISALNRLKIYPVLDGYRGQPGVEIRAIVETVLAVQDYVSQNSSTLLEVEINPLICTQDDAVVADALIRVGS